MSETTPGTNGAPKPLTLKQAQHKYDRLKAKQTALKDQLKMVSAELAGAKDELNAAKERAKAVAAK
jgi:hypothetical protein